MNFNYMEEKTIAIVGAKESGKSHFIAVLLEEIQKKSARFGWMFRACDDDTMDAFDEHFDQPLYRKKLTLDETKAEARQLVYFFSTPKHREPIKLRFYDVGGEVFFKTRSMEKTAPYLRNANGVIYLIDPLKMEPIREVFLRNNFGTKEDLPNEETRENSLRNMFPRMLNFLQSEASCVNDRYKIKIPTAVVLTKIDTIEFLITRDAPVFHPSLHLNGKISGSDIIRNHDYFEFFIRAYEENGVVTTNARNFSRLAYFGVSALGQNPQQAQALKFNPRPIRILDPFLWLLFENKLIALGE